MQPCVSFNKVNTFAWYKQRCRPLPEDYDPTDWEAAMRAAFEFGDRIPTGVIYRNDDLTPFSRMQPALSRGPLVGRGVDAEALREVLDSFA
jgi:2-oxoglutarate ferredoxin oxidoreductase subunit beta